MPQDTHQQARERFQDASDAFRETRVRMVEDLRFSNPADPQQWDTRARQIRENGPDGARPCLTLDRTNQYIAQVVNDARQNKPGPLFMPSSGGARQEVAEALNGIARHIEYQSRAQIAYDTAIEHAARIGLGWIQLDTEVVDRKLNRQELRIRRVADPLSVLCDPDWMEPDGADIQYGFLVTRMTDAAFKRRWPNAKSQTTWESNQSEQGWFQGNSLRICDYFEIVKTKKNMILTVTPEGMRQSVTEDDYWNQAKAKGFKAQVLGQYDSVDCTVMRRRMNGAEILEEEQFPGCNIPLIPVLGYELWIEGQRYLCGMSRRMMDSQRLLNYERSAWAEAVALQPRAPIMADAESLAGHEADWNRMNRANLAYLPFNGVAEDGRPLPPPIRLNPPAMPAAFATGAQFADNDIQASIGMYKSNLGAPSNATSGIAKRQDQREGDTANFHYIDNLSRAVERVWRIAIPIFPVIYDEMSEARILGEDGSTKPVTIDPSGDAYSVRQDGSASINLSTGVYDVRVKAGPAYTTLRQEAADHLTQLMQGQPALAAVIAPIWARMQDWPEADKLSRALLAMAPPPVQAAMQEGQQEDPQVLKQQLQQQEQQMQQMHQAIDMASAEIEKLQAAAQDKHMEMVAKAAELHTADYQAETERLKVVGGAMAPDKLQPIVQQLVMDILSKHPIGAPDPVSQVGPEDLAMDNPMAPPPPPAPEPTEQPASAG